MNIRLSTLPVAGLVLAGVFAFGATGASALGLKDCSDKYSAAKAAGTLGGKSWNEFRKTECGADAKPAADTKPAAEAKKAEPAKAETPKKAETKPATDTAASGAVFPKTVDAKYAKESAYKQRFHTCNDQYKANKANNGNGGLKWIQKGGGYWSECNKILKGKV